MVVVVDASVVVVVAVAAAVATYSAIDSSHQENKKLHLQLGFFHPTSYLSPQSTSLLESQHL